MITLTDFLLGQAGNLRRGGHCYFKPGKPLSSLSPHGARREAGHE
jgi:hypothetical protein